MGYDVNRFESKVPDEFICTICHDVLENPMVTPSCEHIFCEECIKGWLTKGPAKAEPSCPNDRTPASVDSLRPPLRSFRNLLFGLNIRCYFNTCGLFVKLQNLEDHENACMHNPTNMEKEFPCTNNCGAMIKVHNRDKHNCVSYLKKELKLLEQKLGQQILHDSELIKKLEQDNARLVKKCQDDRIKTNEMLLNMKNEIETKETMNTFYHRQLGEAQEELKRLKASTSNSSHNAHQSTSRSSSANSNGGVGRVSPPKGAKPAILPRPGTLKTSQSLLDNSSSAILVDVQEDALQRSPGSLHPNAKFFTSNINLNGTVRSNEERKSSDNSVKHTLNSLFNKFPTIPIPRMNSSSTNGTNSGESSISRSTASTSSGIPIQEPSDLIRDTCQKTRIVQVMQLVNRRHFYPANEYYKAVSTKRGAHSFTLPYEIKLLELIEPYVHGESKILDIGSGLGFITVCLAQLAKFVVGVEHVKELVTKSRDIASKYYGQLNEENRVYFTNEDGRYGCTRFAPYDMILIEPMVRQTIPDIIFNQLKPNGCIIAVIKSETKVQMYKITLNDRKQQVRQTLNSDHHYLSGNHKDILQDIRNQEMNILSRIKNF